MSSIHAKDVKLAYSAEYMQALADETAGETVGLNADLVIIFSRILSRQTVLNETTGAVTYNSTFAQLVKVFTFSATPVADRPPGPSEYLLDDMDSAHASARNAADALFSQISPLLPRRLFVKPYQGIDSVPDRALFNDFLSLGLYQDGPESFHLIANAYNDEIATLALETDDILINQLAWNGGFATMHSNGQTVREIGAQQSRKVIVDSLDTATVQLPSNTLLNENGEPFIILNQGPGAVTIENNAGNPVGSNNGLLQANACQWYYLASRESGGSWLVLGPFDINL